MAKLELATSSVLLLFLVSCSSPSGTQTAGTQGTGTQGIGTQGIGETSSSPETEGVEPKEPAPGSRTPAAIEEKPAAAGETQRLPGSDPSPASGPRALPKPVPMGMIERLDARMDELVPPGVAIEKLAEGFEWSEGPVWVEDGGFILFSDIPRNAVYKWKEGDGLSLYLQPSGYTGSKPRGGEPGSNGLLIDSEGRLVLCQHGDRCIGRIDEGGRRSILADRYEGRRFNSPNDGAFHSNGDLYFTDPPYGLLGKNDDPAKELDFNGVFLLRKQGEVVLLTKEMTFPNGIAFSPDEKVLYVANSDGSWPVWMAFDVEDDGAIQNGREFFNARELAKGRRGGCDGLKVDASGNLFATGPGGVLVFSPDGTHLGTLLTGVATANCAWGDDGSVLYITADMFLCRVRLGTRGAGF